MVLDLTNRVKFYLKRSMLPCFSSWTHKGEMLPFKDFKSMRNHEKGFIRENIVCKFDAMQLYFSDVNHIQLELVQIFVRHLHTQKAVLEKNDHDGYDKHERIFVNSTVLSVRFLFLSQVQSFLSFDGRCALFFFSYFGKTRLALVVQKLDRAIHRINHYPVDKYQGSQ